MTHHIDISWEEKRFWASALILAGMAANYHHNLIPSDFWATGAVSLADHLLQVLSNPSGGTICPDLYQRLWDTRINQFTFRSSRRSRTHSGQSLMSASNSSGRTESRCHLIVSLSPIFMFSFPIVLTAFDISCIFRFLNANIRISEVCRNSIILPFAR